MKDKFYHSKQTTNSNVVQPGDVKAQLVALDTNVFLDMAHRMVGAAKNASLLGQNFYDRLEIMRQKADQKLIKFVIPPTVLSELLHHGLSKPEYDFMKKYCLVLKHKDKVAFATQTNDLAREYLKSGVMKMGKGQHRFGDSIIMAEATIAGLNLLTNNHRDFIIYDEVRDMYKIDKLGDIVPKKNYNDEMLPNDTTHFNENELESFLKIKKRDRALDIRRVNNGMLYGYQNANGFKVIPTPFTTIDYIGKTSEKQGLWRSNQFVTNFNSNDFELANYERNM